MGAIAGIDKNNRLIKGQVFLWKDGQTWEDLWDVNGERVLRRVCRDGPVFNLQEAVGW